MILAGSFAISAAMHIFVAPDVPISCLAWPQFRYYASIAMAIVMEDLVVVAYRRWRNNGSQVSTRSTQGSATPRTTTQNGLRHRKKPTQSKEPEKSAQESRSPPEYGSGSSKAWYLVGYVWVFAFEVWSCSKAVYITTQCKAQLDSLI